ncbi:MAG: TIGR03546 family protein [Treponema sp.]|nr:TIGR03546 family protein [Treponema sp.]
MIGYIVKLIKSLNANSNPGEIAHAVSIGILLGLMPKNNLLWYILFVFFLFVRINKGCYFIFMIIASLIAPVFDGIFDTIGYSILTLNALQPTFGMLLDIPFVGFTKFNNTIVTGSLCIGLIAYIPFYILFRVLIQVWRKTLANKFAQSKVSTMLYQIPIVGKILSLSTGDDL